LQIGNCKLKISELPLAVDGYAMAQVFVNDAYLHVLRCGAGSPLLFVHGFPLDHSMWSGQIDALSERYYVIAPDLRGFGLSGGLLPTLSMTQHADDLAALLDALEITEPVVFCGLSMGGYIALKFWERHRDKLRALVLCDNRAAADTPEAVAARMTMAQRVLNEGASLAADAMLPKLFPVNIGQSNPQAYEAIKQVILRTPPETIAAAQRGLAERSDMRGELPQIQVPTLVVCGEEDVLAPLPEMQAIAAAIPHSQFAMIAGAGHMSPLEKPAEFNRLLAAFLAALS
jgi:pimeloyl-ACP methyl ester carboxylesterase